MSNLESILKKLRENKSKILSKYPVQDIAVFGSYARNEQKENSDIDTLVDCSGDIGSNFITLADEFEIILNNKVDLVSKNGIKNKYYEYLINDLIYV